MGDKKREYERSLINKIRNKTQMENKWKHMMCKH